LPGAVVKGQHQHDAAAISGGLVNLRSRLGAGANRKKEGQRKAQSQGGGQLPNPA
jgi:hypothetical protein